MAFSVCCHLEFDETQPVDITGPASGYTLPPLPSFRAEVYAAPVSLTMSEEESKNTARFRHRYQADPIPVERKSKRVQVIQPNRYIGGVALLFSVFDGIWCHWVDNWIEEFWASRKWGMGCYCWLLKMTAFLSPDYVRKWCNMASKKLLNWPHVPLSLMDKIQTSKIFSRPVPVVVRTFKSNLDINWKKISEHSKCGEFGCQWYKADCLVVSLWLRTIFGVIAVHLLKRGGLTGIIRKNLSYVLKSLLFDWNKTDRKRLHLQMRILEEIIVNKGNLFLFQDAAMMHLKKGIEIEGSKCSSWLLFHDKVIR